MSVELIVALTGAGGSALLVLLAQAVTWGRVRQTLEHQAQAARETLELVQELRQAHVESAQRTTALETTAEDHDGRLDRLEAPLFYKRH